VAEFSPARAQAMAGAKGPSTAGFGTRSECKKWALAKTNASRNPSRDAQCAAVISSSWGARLIARATRVPRYRMSSASKRHGGRFLRRDAGYGDASRISPTTERNSRNNRCLLARLPRTTLLTPRALLAGWAASATALDRLHVETPRRCAVRPAHAARQPAAGAGCTAPRSRPSTPSRALPASPRAKPRRLHPHLPRFAAL
jgi:hypothetical protein